MWPKVKVIYCEIVISVIIHNLNTVVPDATFNSRSFRKCLEYKEVNGTIDDLISIDILVPERRRGRVLLSFMDPDDMSQSHRKRRTLIVAGGQNANREQLPFITALGYGDEKQIKYDCGGTLISERFVLTAAHCILSRTWGIVKFVRLGDLNIQGKFDDDGVQMRHVQEYYIHPNFKFPSKYHDVALIKLDEPVVFSTKISPACLDFSRDQLPQNNLYVAGWGAIGYGEKQSDHLQVARVVNYNISECQKTFPKELTLPSGIDDESQICAGAGIRLTDTCEGDSGGPLGHSYLRQGKRIHFVIGVTSFGKACQQGRIPGVYTRVSYYTDWIESIVWPETKRIPSDKIFFPTD